MTTSAHEQPGPVSSKYEEVSHQAPRKPLARRQSRFQRVATPILLTTISLYNKWDVKARE